MKIIRISKSGNYTNFGIGYTEHDGYQGSCANRLSVKSAIANQMRCIKEGEQYQIEIDGKNQGTFIK